MRRNLQFFVWIDELGLVALVAWLVASIGAFRLWRPARALYLVAVALCVAASSTTETEPAITPAVLDAIAQLGCVTSGLVLGLLSEARQHFRRERP